MIQVSQRARDVINGYTRTFKAQLLLNGAALSCDISTIVINKGACNEFTIGSAYVPYIEVTASNLDADIKDESIVLRLGVVLDRTTGQTEWFEIGSYFVTSVRKTTNKTIFTANGILAVKGKLMYNSTLSYPASISAVIAEMQSKFGITIIGKGIQLSGTITTSLDGKLCLDVLRDIAGVLGGFVTEDNQGRVVIAKHGSGELLEVEAFRSQVPPEFLDSYTVTGLEMIATEDGYDEDGNLIAGTKYVSGTPNIIVNNPLATQALFNVAKDNVIGFAFDPTSFTMNMGDPTLEAWDKLRVIDVDGNPHIVPCINISHRFDGGVSTEILAEVLNEVTGAVAGTISSQLADLEAKLFTAQQAIIKRATITALDAESARIDALNTIKAYVETLIAGDVTADSIVAQSGEIESLKTNKADVNLLNVNTAQITNGVIDNLSAGAIKSGTIDSNRINANTVVSNGLEANKAAIGQIAANDANVKNLIAESIDADQIVADGLEANKAAIGSIATESIDADTIVANGIEANKGDIADLVAQNLKTGSINGIAITDNSIVAKALAREVVTTLTGMKVYYQATPPIANEQPDGTYEDLDGHVMKNGDTWYQTMLANDSTILNPLNAINDTVKDTYADGVITRRVGVVDLGSLNWNYTASALRFRGTDLSPIAKDVSSGNIGVCDGYTVSSLPWRDADRTNLQIMPKSKYVYARNFAYTDASSFKQAMQGVMLYYELAEPYEETGTLNNSIMSIWIDDEWVETPLDGSVLRANSITGQEIAANTITGNNIAGNSLSIGNMDETVMSSKGERGQMQWSDNALHITSSNANKTEKYETEIGGDGIKFKYQDQTVASIDQDQLIIDKTLVFTEMKIGNWSWAINPVNGNLMVKWGGN